MLSDLALEIVGDTAIVWLLSPRASFRPRPAGGLARFTSSLPGYCLQVPRGSGSGLTARDPKGIGVHVHCHCKLRSLTIMCVSVFRHSDHLIGRRQSMQNPAHDHCSIPRLLQGSRSSVTQFVIQRCNLSRWATSRRLSGC